MKRLAIIILFTGLFQRIRGVDKWRRRQSDKMRGRYKTELYTGRVRIRGINVVEVEDVCIGRQGISVKIERVTVAMNFFKALKRRSLAKALEVRLTKATISLQNIGHAAPEVPPGTSSINIVQKLERKLYGAYQKLTRVLARYMPQKLSAAEIRIEPGRWGICAVIRSFNYSEGIFSTGIDIISGKSCLMLAARGNAGGTDHSIELYSRNDNTGIQAPFSAGSIMMVAKLCDTKGTHTINLRATMKDVRWRHRAFSAEQFMVRSGALECNVLFNKSSFVIADDCCGSLDEIPFSLYFSHDEKESDIIRLVFLLDADPVAILQFLPGLSILSGKNVGVTGNLTLKFSLIFSISNPYEHFFDIEVLENNIVVEETRQPDLSYLERPFSHSICKNGVFLRSIMLDENLNINYCRADGLPLKFPAILIYAEDPNFYGHRGVDIFFAGYAIVVNIARRKFIRGGSTITMQLVRNLFLNHDKNLVRKIEEIFIALLIENVFRIPKNRLLEIYLNVIEFGPDIYGITEASKFYFNKLPFEMTLLECLMVTYIIPRPVHFYDALKQKTLQLNVNLTRHIGRMASGLLAHAVITQEEYDSIMMAMSEKLVFDHFDISALAMRQP